MQVALDQSEMYNRLLAAGWTLDGIDLKNGIYQAKATGPGGQKIDRVGQTPDQALAFLLQFAVRSNQIRRFAALRQVLSGWSQSFTDQLEQIGRAYSEMPVFDPKAVASWKALANESQRQADVIRSQIDVEVTDSPDPYPNVQEMIHDVHHNRRFQVSRAHANHPVWIPDDVVNFRIVDDVIGHAQSGADWSWTGVNQAFQIHAPLVTPLAREALFVETVGKAAYFGTSQGRGPVKVGFLSEYLQPVQDQEGEHVSVPHGGVPDLSQAAAVLEQPNTYAPQEQQTKQSAGEGQQLMIPGIRPGPTEEFGLDTQGGNLDTEWRNRLPWLLEGDRIEFGKWGQFHGDAFGNWWGDLEGATGAVWRRNQGGYTFQIYMNETNYTDQQLFDMAQKKFPYPMDLQEEYSDDGEDGPNGKQGWAAWSRTASDWEEWAESPEHQKAQESWEDYGWGKMDSGDERYYDYWDKRQPWIYHPKLDKLFMGDIGTFHADLMDNNRAALKPHGWVDYRTSYPVGHMVGDEIYGLNDDGKAVVDKIREMIQRGEYSSRPDRMDWADDNPHEARTADYDPTMHSRDSMGRFTIKKVQHEVKVHDAKGKHSHTLKWCKHCGYGYAKPKDHVGRVECPTCGSDPERRLGLARVVRAADEAREMADQLGWQPGGFTREGHRIFQWDDDLGTKHRVTVGSGKHGANSAHMDGYFARQRMVKCMGGKCMHSQLFGQVGIPEQVTPGRTPINVGDQVRSEEGKLGWIIEIDGSLGLVNFEDGSEDIKPVKELEKAVASTEYPNIWSHPGPQGGSPGDAMTYYKFLYHPEYDQIAMWDAEARHAGHPDEPFDWPDIHHADMANHLGWGWHNTVRGGTTTNGEPQLYGHGFNDPPKGSLAKRVQELARQEWLRWHAEKPVEQDPQGWDDHYGNSNINIVHHPDAQVFDNRPRWPWLVDATGTMHMGPRGGHHDGIIQDEFSPPDSAKTFGAVGAQGADIYIGGYRNEQLQSYIDAANKWYQENVGPQREGDPSQGWNSFGKKAELAPTEKDPSWQFVYYQGALEIKKWHHNTKFAEMAKKLLEDFGQSMTDVDWDDDTKDWAAGDVYEIGDEIFVDMKQLADTHVQIEALNAVHRYVDDHHALTDE